MNLNKSREFFDPEQLNSRIHIIGCGAVGSTIAENLTRLGVKELYLWDFDTVESHNIANQMFLNEHINLPKMDAVEAICKSINPNIIIHKQGKYTKQIISGYLFIGPDSIAVRKAILTNNLGNPNIKGVFDGRMRLTDAQHFASDWTTLEKKQALLDTMDYTDEEADADTPVSACGTSLSVVYTVRCLVSLMIANFVEFVLTGNLRKMITLDLASFVIDAFLDK